jgi:hypothetical protein
MIINEGVVIGCFFIWTLRNFMPLRKGFVIRHLLSLFFLGWMGDFSAGQKRFADLMKCP